MWQEQLNKAQIFLDQGACTTKKVFKTWFCNTHLHSSEGRALPRSVKRQVQKLCTCKGFLLDTDCYRSSHPKEVIKVFQLWEGIEIVEGSAEWKTARLRMLRDIIYRGAFPEHKRKGLEASAAELAATRSWFLTKADGRIVKYPSIVFPLCFKDLVWDASTKSHRMVLRNAGTVHDPNAVSLLDVLFQRRFIVPGASLDGSCRAKYLFDLHNPFFGQRPSPPMDTRTRLLLRARSTPKPKKEEGPEPMEL